MTATIQSTPIAAARDETTALAQRFNCAAGLIDAVRESRRRGDDWETSRLMHAILHPPGTDTKSLPSGSVFELESALQQIPTEIASTLDRWRQRLRPSLSPVLSLAYLGLGTRVHKWLHYRRPAHRPVAVPPPRGTHPLATVVILAHNRRAYIEYTLDAFHATVGDRDFELIVVDNGSTDDTPSYLQEQVRLGRIDKLVVSARNLGVPAGFNLGFRCADPAAEFFVRLDADQSILTPGWLQAFRRFLNAHPHVGMLALYSPNHPTLRTLPVERSPDGQRVVDWRYWACGGGAMTMPRRTIEAVGLLREDIGYHYVPDDADYYLRLHALGLRAYYLRDYHAYHHRELDQTVYRRYSESKNRLIGFDPLNVWSIIRAHYRASRSAWDARMFEIRAEYQHDPARGVLLPLPSSLHSRFSASERILTLP